MASISISNKKKFLEAYFKCFPPEPIISNLAKQVEKEGAEKVAEIINVTPDKLLAALQPVTHSNVEIIYKVLCTLHTQALIQKNLEMFMRCVK